MLTKAIARQYAGYTGLESGWPVVLASPKTRETDNKKIENYALTKVGVQHIGESIVIL